MLEALRIRDLGVIRDVAVEFGPGLNAVTGETGAGKTMVVTGLNLLFGGRADASRIRTGADAASVEGRLRLSSGSPAADRALDAGGEIEDGELLLRRTVTTAGRSRAHVGGSATPVSVLGELGEDVVVIHGQADQMRLSRPGAQRQALDRYAGIDVTSYRRAFEAWRSADNTLAERLRDRGALVRESDLLSYGLGEIEALTPRPGENVDLAEQAARLGAADELRLAARTAHDALLGDPDDPTSDTPDIRMLLTVAHRRLDQAAPADPALQVLSERMTDLLVATDDLGAELAAYGEGLDADPAQLGRVESRRAELNALIRKYADAGTDLAGVLDWAERARERLARIDTSPETLAELTERRDTAENFAAQAAGELSRARSAAAAALARAVTDELHGLAMADARLHVIVRDRAPLAGGPSLAVAGHRCGAGPDGVDEVEFALAPHPDVEPVALHKGASGGELSRVMLALEVVLAGTDPVPVMVFDEVDAGVGGRAAVEVGRRLARLGQQHQVIVVTHLAQVAAFADRHLAVRAAAGSARFGPTAGVNDGAEPSDFAGLDGDRVAGAGRTVSEVVVVEGDDRVAELARMLAGRDTGTAREHASELLGDAAAAKALTAPGPTGGEVAGTTGGTEPRETEPRGTAPSGTAPSGTALSAEPVERGARRSSADPSKIRPGRRPVHS